MSQAKNIRPFFLYFGGKWRLAKRYPEPVHNMVVEPFAGAAGYAMRYHDRDVVLFDLDEKVCGTWEYLINVPEKEILKLPLYGEWQSIDDIKACEEAKWLIGRWLNKGTASPSKTPSAWMRDERYASQFWSHGVRERIASQLKYIRHWEIYHDSYENIDIEIPATYFIDPPYIKAGKGYKYSDIDYEHLGSWCKELSGQVIVCEGPDADWLPFKPFRSAHAMSGARRSGKSQEFIWTNEEEF